MLCAGLLITALMGQGPMIAYAAQYYNPPGSHRQATHSQLYVCDFDGRHRRQLTFAKGDSFSVRWVNQNEIQFQRQFKEGGPDSTFKLDLRTGKEHLISRSQYGSEDGAGEEPTLAHLLEYGERGSGFEQVETSESVLTGPDGNAKVVFDGGEASVDNAGKRTPIHLAYGLHRAFWLAKTHYLWLTSWTTCSTGGQTIDIHRANCRMRF